MLCLLPMHSYSVTLHDYIVLLVTSNCCPPCSVPVQVACSLMGPSRKTLPLHPPPCPPFLRGGRSTRLTMVASTIITASLGNPPGHTPWRSPLLLLSCPPPILPATRLLYWRFVTWCHVMSHDVQCMYVVISGWYIPGLPFSYWLTPFSSLPSLFPSFSPPSLSLPFFSSSLLPLLSSLSLPPSLLPFSELRLKAGRRRSTLSQALLSSSTVALGSVGL